MAGMWYSFLRNGKPWLSETVKNVMGLKYSKCMKVNESAPNKDYQRNMKTNCKSAEVVKNSIIMI